ncbi:hypothetical protein JCM3775_004866 [Rhodotorula graminis]
MSAEASSSVAEPPKRVKRSQFIDKLHALLEHPLDEESFHWTDDGKAFEITTNELKARHALSAQYEFRSLSSFIRQLSYYNFKRLTDRRKSVERKTGNAAFISFMHPSGFFVSGDSSQLDNIIRKTRARRVEPRRRDSLASTTSADSASSPYPQYDDGQAGPSYSTAPRHSFSYAPPPSAYPQQPARLPPDSTAAWPGYSTSIGPPAAPVASGSSFPAYLGAPSSYGPQYEPSHWTQPGYRRASLTQFRADTSPRTKPADAPGAQAYQHSSGSSAPHALPSVPSDGDLRSSYASAGYPVELGGRPPAPAGYHYVDQAPSIASQHHHVVPSGLPIASHDSVPHRPSWPPASGSFYTSMPHPHDDSPTLAPLQSYHGHAHPHPHPHPHQSQQDEPVAAGTAYSSEDDTPPAHAHAAPHSHPHTFFSAPTSRLDPSTSAHQQPYLAGPAVNLFPNLTHFHLPPLGAATSTPTAVPHSHSYEQWRAHVQQQEQQEQDRRASVQLPPFASVGPAASPAQYSHVPPPHEQYARQLQQQQYGDGGSSGRTTPVHGAGPSGKLGWAPQSAPAHATGPGAATTSVFGQWAGFGAHGPVERESPGHGDAGGREGDERGAGS